VQGYALDAVRHGMQVGLMVLLPILAVALFVGLIVSILQALTQIQEQTLSFVPKLLGVALVVAMMGHWMLGEMVGYTRFCFGRIAIVGRGVR
jgi:flagellar biosynthesis protein FliQ